MAKAVAPEFDFAQKVSQARYLLNRECPFLATLVNKVPVLISTEIPTACVVNRGEMGEMWMNPEFFSDLGVGETGFVMAHEVMHLAYGVFPRLEALGEGACTSTVNEAHDYLINGQLQELVSAFPSCGMKIPTGDKAPLLDRRLSDGKCLETLYAELLKKKQEQKKSQAAQGEGQGQGAGQSKGQGQGESQGQGQGQGKGESQGQGQNPGAQAPKPAGKGYSDATDIVVEPKKGCSPEESKKVTDEQARRWQNALAEAMAIHETWKAGGTGRGDLPGSVLETIKSILAPEVNWIERVFQMAEGHLRGDSLSYSRLSKRGIALDTILPGRGRNRPRLGWVLDTSGSMGSDDLALMGGIGEQVASVYEASCRMIHVDAGVTVDEEVDDLASYFQGTWEVKGRGGTVFEPALEALTNDGEPVDLVILCTDGYVSWPAFESWPCPVFVLTTGEMPPAPYEGVKVEQPRRGR